MLPTARSAPSSSAGRKVLSSIAERSWLRRSAAIEARGEQPAPRRPRSAERTSPRGSAQPRLADDAGDLLADEPLDDAGQMLVEPGLQQRPQHLAHDVLERAPPAPIGQIRLGSRWRGIARAGQRRRPRRSDVAADKKALRVRRRRRRIGARRRRDRGVAPGSPGPARGRPAPGGDAPSGASWRTEPSPAIASVSSRMPPLSAGAGTAIGRAIVLGDDAANGGEDLVHRRFRIE